MDPINQYLLDGDLNQLIMSVAQMVQEMSTHRVTQNDILPSAVKQRHIQGIIVFRGDIANRPTDGSTEIQAYWAEDENKLYIWNSESLAWKSATLS